MKYRLIVLVLIFAIQIPQFAHAKPNKHSGHIIVKFRDNTTANQQKALIKNNRHQVARRIPQLKAHTVKIPRGRTAEQVMSRYQRHPLVEFTEPNYLIQKALVPNDPLYAGNQSQWHLDKIEASTAWDTSVGNPLIPIVIMDTGVFAGHEDLSGKVLPGWNIVSENNNTGDIQGHGTMVAGTAAALSNNGIGVTSVAWDCPIIPVVVSDPTGWATLDSLAGGVVWAADNGIRVVNASFESFESSTMTSAAEYLASIGGVLIHAAGNDGRNHRRSDTPAIIHVSATDSTDTITSWSTTGDFVDISAPGSRILTTSAGGDLKSSAYMFVDGTSFSAPIVAGVAALVISTNPDLTGAEVREILTSTSDDLGFPGKDTTYGWGRVNAHKAVEAAFQTIPDTTPPTVTITEPHPDAILRGVAKFVAIAQDDKSVTHVQLFKQ